MSLYQTEFERQRREQNILTNRATLWQRKRDPCADCGLRWHPAVMTFDHVDRRTITKNKNAKNINAILYYNPEMFNRALRAGSFVCKNCHFLREMRRDIDGPMAPKYYKEEFKALLPECKGALLLPSKEA